MFANNPKLICRVNDAKSQRTTLIVCLFVISFLFPRNAMTQRIADGINLGSEEYFGDLWISNVLIMSQTKGSAKENGVFATPLQLRMLIAPRSNLKGELSGFFSMYASDISKDNYGCGAGFTLAARYDDELLSFPLNYSFRLGYLQNKTNYGNVYRVLNKPNAFLDFSQSYEVTSGTEFIATEGVLYTPYSGRVYPTVFLGARLGKILNVGVDVTSFFQSREDYFMKQRVLF